MKKFPLNELRRALEQGSSPNPHLSEICHDIGGLNGCIVIDEFPREERNCRPCRFVTVDPANGQIIEYGDSDNTILYFDTDDDRANVNWVFDLIKKEVLR